MKFKLIRTLSCLVAVACVFLLTIPAMATGENLRSIYDGILTKQEQKSLSYIDKDDVENASLPSYQLWRVMPWLYEQAGIDIEFPNINPSARDVLFSRLFSWLTGGNSFQVKPLTGASAETLYFLNQFTGLRGGTKSFQDSALTYSNFNWQIGDLFVGYYIDGDITYNYVAMYRGQDFLEFCETGTSRNIYLSDMRDIFSRTYDCYAVIRPQQLADEWTIVDYNDYIENLYVDGANDIVTLDFPPYLCGTQINDMRGLTYLPGQDNGMMRASASSFPSAGVYLPGSHITKTVLDLSNIPDGSIFTSSGSITVETWDGWTYGSDYIGGFVFFGLQYYDENFNLIGANNQIVKNFGLDIYGSEYYWEMSIACNPPDNAKYCVYYGRVEIDEYSREKAYTTLLFDFDMTSLQMSISSLYRQQEQTGKQNELLENIVTGTPEQNESAENAAGQMGEQADKIGGLLNQATPSRPPLDSVNLTEIIPDAGVSVLTSTLSPIINNELVVKIMLMVATLMLVGYVLFGKKGG